MKKALASCYDIMPNSDVPRGQCLKEDLVFTGKLLFIQEKSVFYNIHLKTGSCNHTTMYLGSKQINRTGSSASS